MLDGARSGVRGIVDELGRGDATDHCLRSVHVTFLQSPYEVMEGTIQ
jgi:hypothetical protein